MYNKEKGRYIIQPLQNGYKTVCLSIEELEQFFYPDAREGRATTDALHRSKVAEDVVKTLVVNSALSVTRIQKIASWFIPDEEMDMVMESSEFYSSGMEKRYEAMLLSYKTGKPKEQCFYNNLISGNFSTIGKRFSSCFIGDIPTSINIEYGKYLILLTGHIDLWGVEDGNEILWNVKYSSQGTEKEIREGEENVFIGKKYKNTDNNLEILKEKYDADIYSERYIFKKTTLKKNFSWRFNALSRMIQSDNDSIHYGIHHILKNTAKEKNICPNIQEVILKVKRENIEKIMKFVLKLYCAHLDKAT